LLYRLSYPGIWKRGARFREAGVFISSRVLRCPDQIESSRSEYSRRDLGTHLSASLGILWPGMFLDLKKLRGLCDLGGDPMQTLSSGAVFEADAIELRICGGQLRRDSR
jgi:hypothetical protein